MGKFEDGCPDHACEDDSSEDGLGVNETLGDNDPEQALAALSGLFCAWGFPAAATRELPPSVADPSEEVDLRSKSGEGVLL